MNFPEPTTEEKLRSALQAAVDTIADYLAYEHEGDPWSEDARVMGEMDINYYGSDGRLAYARGLLGYPLEPNTPEQIGEDSGI